MRKIRGFVGPFVLAAAMVVPMIGAGCAARVRYYDVEYRDYHRWDDAEERAYRAYCVERHVEYREWVKLNEREQREYWKWRHDHPGRY